MTPSLRVIRQTNLLTCEFVFGQFHLCKVSLAECFAEIIVSNRQQIGIRVAIHFLLGLVTHCTRGLSLVKRVILVCLCVLSKTKLFLGTKQKIFQLMNFHAQVEL